MFDRKPWGPPRPPMGPPPVQRDCHVEEHLPNMYPYINPKVHDSYAHDCYHEYHGYPHPHEFPASGSMQGSAFMLLSYYPYLFDNTHVTYANFLNTSESVLTRVSQRRDDSCVNLYGTFDLKKGINKNTIMTDYLEKCIGHNFDSIGGLLPLMKSDITFRLYFSVTDEANGVVYQNAISTTVTNMGFHFTDIRDFFVESMNGVFITNIPAMDYSGIYRLTLEKIEAWGEIINTVDHVTNGLNPYYQFTDNNNTITMQHDVINGTMTDNSILIASATLNNTIPFQANITTRLRLNFTAFLSDLIAVPQTYGIYNAMFEPSDVKLERLSKEVATLKESASLINKTLLELGDALNELRTTVSTHTTQIEANTNAITELQATVESDNEELAARIDDLDARVRVLENRPLALYKYNQGVEFVRSQLTWSTYGQIYQVARDFTASGNMETDINNGYLVPLIVDGDVVTAAFESRIETLESGLSVTNEAIDTIETSVQSHSDELVSLNTLVAGKANSAIVVELIDRMGVAETSIDTKASQTDLEALTTRVETLEET